MSTSTQRTSEMILAELLLLRADLDDLRRVWHVRFGDVILQLDRMEAAYQAFLADKGTGPVVEHRPDA